MRHCGEAHELNEGGMNRIKMLVIDMNRPVECTYMERIRRSEG